MRTSTVTLTGPLVDGGGGAHSLIKSEPMALAAGVKATNVPVPTPEASAYGSQNEVPTPEASAYGSQNEVPTPEASAYGSQSDAFLSGQGARASADGLQSQLDDVEALLDEAGKTECPAPELSVVIPVYNEPVTVLEIVRRVQSLPLDTQIIVINDGSSDETPDRLRVLECDARILVLHHPINRGKGAALRTGFRHARGRYVIVQDADLEYDPRDIIRVLAPLKAGECDVVYGSRYLENARQDPSRLHRLGNWGLTAFSNLLSGYQLTDMETCYKAFRREVLQSMHIEQSRFGFEPEITAKLARRKIAIKEVAVSYSSRGREEGKKIGWRDLFNTLYCIVRYRFTGTSTGRATVTAVQTHP